MKSNFVLPLILLTALSLLTHLAFFGYPSAVVFDELYNGSFISAYHTGSFYFDIHPPLAKIISKFFGYLVGIPYNVDFGAIGNALPQEIILLRVLPVIAGIILPLIIYLICQQLNLSKIASFTAGMLMVLENSLIVQSRFILFDSIMLLFGFSAILLYLIYVKDDKRWYLLIFSVLLAAGAYSIKWTGLAFPLFIIIFEIVRTRKFLNTAKTVLVYGIIGLFFYMSVFAIHFAYLDHTGHGDAFMTDRFQKTLIGSSYENDASLKPKGFFGKFIELNLQMYDANKTLNATHMYASKWHTWPLMLKPVFYWQSTPTAGHYIYLLGNPFIYWLGTLSIISLIFHSIFKKHNRKIPLLILAGFLVNFIPFIFISRVMFLYHYEAALIFSIIAMVFLIDQIKKEKNKIIISSSIIVISLTVFIYFSPLTYGLYLNEEGLSSRIWLSSWR